MEDFAACVVIPERLVRQRLAKGKTPNAADSWWADTRGALAIPPSLVEGMPQCSHDPVALYAAQPDRQPHRRSARGCGRMKPAN